MKKNSLLLIFVALILLSSCSKSEVVKSTDKTDEVLDVTEAIDMLSDEKLEEAESKVLAEHENAIRVSDFLFSETNERGDVTSIVTLADRNVGVKTFTYDALDLEPEYDSIAALTINFDEKTVPDGAEELISDDGENVIIKSGGIYVLKGTLNNKRIKIENGIGPRVQIVLDGVKINTDKESAISIADGCIAQIFLASGSENEINIKEVSGSKVEKMNGAIYSKNEIAFNGKGKLIINNNFESSIESEDKITFISGDYKLNSKGDAIKAENEVIFRSGNFEINSGDDAIKVKSNKKGMLYIENANIDISSGDKGLTSDNDALIVGGTINVDAKGECITGKVINLLGGNINLKTSDDAINASDGKQDKKINQEGVYIRILGGDINIDSIMDGIDSNGDLYLEGGKVFISASENDNERIIDYNGKVECNIGFEMIGVGPGAKMQDLGSESKQNYIVVYYKDVMSANNNIELIDEGGNVILSYKPNKTYKAALITSTNLEEEENYKIISGDKELNVKIVKGKNEIVE